MLKKGAIAPAIDTVDHRGQRVVLDELVARGPVVVYFYPRDMTLGCTKEACAFRDAYPELQKIGCTVVGVSYDTLESHRMFAEMHNLPFPLISDEDKSLATAYDVRGFFDLFPKRVTFLLGTGRVVLGVFHHEVSMHAHVRDIQSALKAA